jgi:hypothetical protein
MHAHELAVVGCVQNSSKLGDNLRLKPDVMQGSKAQGLLQ